MDHDIYNAVAARANRSCEACGGSGYPFPLELDHMLGRKHVEETEYNCWLLCRSCHVAKTNNKPDFAYWARIFITRHCERWAFKGDPTNGYLLAAAEAKKQMEWRLARMGRTA